MAVTTKTFLELVNDTIDESGEDLGQFRTDGSDFTTQSDAMMNRFKKWVRRAWLDIQEDANDWHWLDEIAVVNITPGIMFYSDTPISASTAAINPAVIVDVDDSTQVEGLAVSNVYDLTTAGKHPFGYMNLMYDDYSYTNQHALDFGLKAGGERLTKGNDGRVSFLTVFNNSSAYAAAGYVETGDTVNSITITNNHDSTSTVCTFTGCTVDVKSINGQFVSLTMSYANVSPDPFAKMVQIAEGSSVEFSIGFSLEIATANGNKTLSGTIRLDDIGNQFLLTGAITPFNYNLNMTSTTQIGDQVEVGDGLGWAMYGTLKGAGARNFIMPIDAIVNQLYSDPTGTTGIFNISLRAETGITTTVWLDSVEADPLCWTLWTGLLFASAPVAQPNFTGMFFFVPESYSGSGTISDLSVGAAITLYSGGEEKATWDFEYALPYLHKNYIHSWKSFDWNEETDRDDFVSDIRNIHYNTFRLIMHEDPSPPGELPLQYVTWPVFQNKYDFASSIPSKPRLISQDPTGRWRMYPPIDKPYTVKFDYIRSSQKLEAFSDIPRGLPDEYVDMIMWKALCYYGEYDEQPAVAARANKNYKNLLLQIQQELRNAFALVPRRLY